MLEGRLFPVKVKGKLILMMTRKILGYSQNTVEWSEVGRITNIISSDFNRIEERCQYLFYSLALPIPFLVITIIIFYRLGWLGLVLFLIIALAIGLQFLLGKL